ncbi:MAG: acetyltransferase [Oscillospiraceae bacterium]|nr:acetyltransferase [Oscillospiraceae bacterium]
MIRAANKEYIILGAGGHGAVIADILTKRSFTIKGFLDDGVAVGTVVMGVKVLGKINLCVNYSECMFIIGVGNNAIRKQIAETYSLEYGSAIHPSAIIGDQVKIGRGSVLMAGCVVNPRTSIGQHCIVNTSASLDHDNTVGDFVHVSPGAVSGGDVRIGAGTHIGIGACVRNGISICSDVVIGAGAVVVKSITEPGVYIGVPAKRKSMGA